MGWRAACSGPSARSSSWTSAVWFGTGTCTRWVGEAADGVVADHDLGEGHQAGALDELGPAVRVLCQIDLGERDLVAFQQGLRLAAASTGIGTVDDDSLHYFTKYS